MNSHDSFTHPRNSGNRRGRYGPARVGPGRDWTLRRFRRDEDGGLVIFSVFMFLIILFLGALGVDMMRFEMERAKLQSTLDRAVLAAADIDQNLDPTMVVNDYFTKAGLGGSVTGVTVTEGLGFRGVSATARKTIKTQMIHMLGVDTMTAPASGAAEERVDNVEISLVLDISGSMANNNRMTNLRAAGLDFINAIFENASQDKVSMSIVPYNGQVNIGPDLITKYNITHRHSSTFCVDLPPSVYSTAALSRTLPMPQHVFADTFNTSNTSLSYDTTNMAPGTTNRWCDPNPVNRVRVHSNNVTQLRAHINALQPVGATSIDAGMRWGSALLDPAARSVVTELVGEGVVNPAFAGRPFDYNDPEVLKVLVLMTDGEHWPDEFVNDPFRSGLSPVWVNTQNQRLSIRHDRATNPFYWPSLNAWYDRPEGAISATSMGTAVRLTWPQVWERARVAWVAHHLYVRPLGGTLASRMNTLRTRTGTVIGSGPHEVSVMNNRLLELCTRVKQQGVVIYTVAFEAPAAGRTLLNNCASSANHAFDVNGLEIRSAFASIATSIRKLRLTQ
jgi:Flp pilus assembly protein TadG